ncbi:hypothetical protein J4208_05685 [Candidatus Woesearchaeota archaeon]|nr:hypothetical protein [Candidatus Woesearchaeota archaeon]
MNKTLGKLFLTSIVFLLAFSIFGQAQDPVKAKVQDPIRTDATPATQGPKCDDGDKGRCQAVCNVHQNANGTPNPGGSVTAFSNFVNQGPGIVCARGDTPILVGCDLPSAEPCTNAQGQTGVWAKCYYRCQSGP